MDAASARASARRAEVEAPVQGEGNLPVVRLSPSLIRRLRTKVGDPVYITDTRWWLGGLHSMHVVVGGELESDGDSIEIGPDTYDLVVTHGREGKLLRVERLY